MEDNPDQEEAKSCPILGEGKLWVKLKIPRDELKKADFEDQIIGFKEKSDLGGHMRIRVCHVCQKAFSSGKALGGHMRIHVQKAKKNPKAHKTIKFKKPQNQVNAGLCDMIDEPICIICRKDFRSMKSLYGHMRCHPDRDWRGINPPLEKINTSSFSCSSALEHTNQDRVENAVVDLKESLWGWKMTAKRGRKALMDESKSEISSSDDYDHEAVSYLMMLAHEGNYHESTKMEGKMSNGIEKRALEGGLVLGNLVEKLENYDRLDDSDFENAESEKVVKNGKKMEKVISSHLISARKGSPTQALGSSHNKLKLVIQDSTGKSGSDSNPTALVEEEVDKGSSSLRMLDVDLNELPPSDDEAGLSLNYLTIGNCDSYASLP